MSSWLNIADKMVHTGNEVSADCVYFRWKFILSKQKISYTTDLGNSLILSPVKVIWYFQRRIKYFITERMQLIISVYCVHFKFGFNFDPTFCPCNTIKSVLKSAKNAITIEGSIVQCTVRILNSCVYIIC